MRSALLRAVVVMLVLVSTGACGGRSVPPDDLVGLAAAVPADIASRGMLLRRGTEGASLLLDRLGLTPDRVAATLTTGAPAVHLLRTPAAAQVADGLEAAGFTDADAPADWRILVRPAEAAPQSPGVRGDDRFVGVPAVAIGPDLVVTGSVAEVQAVAVGAAPLPVVEEALATAEVALVQPSTGVEGASGALGAVPPFSSTVLTVGEDGTSGRLALRLAAAGTQEDAVGLAVRVRTAGPVDDDGTALLDPQAPLTSGDVVSLEVHWSRPAPERLAAGLGSGLLDFITRP